MSSGPTSIDFADWIRRVRTFADGLSDLPGEMYHLSCTIDPPLPLSELDAIAEKWPHGVPSTLARLWTDGSSRIDFSYCWLPPENEVSQLSDIFDDGDESINGHLVFLPANKVFPSRSHWADCFEGDNSPEGVFNFNVWSRCAVFLDMENGDSLGLDPEINPADPPVVYLSHEGSSDYFEESFSTLLRKWQDFCYIDPGLLCDFWDEEKKSIQVKDEVINDLRTLLTPR